MSALQDIGRKKIGTDFRPTGDRAARIGGSKCRVAQRRIPEQIRRLLIGTPRARSSSVKPPVVPRAPRDHSDPRRPFALKLIIGYKFAKAPLVLLLAGWLTASPHGAEHVAHELVRELNEGGALFARLGTWLGLHSSPNDLRHATLLAWGDGLVTLLEGVLLLRGHAWGEWIVVAALAALVPFEVASLERHPGPLKLIVLALNVAIVAYLAGRRWEEHRLHG